MADASESREDNSAIGGSVSHSATGGRPTKKPKPKPVDLEKFLSETPNPGNWSLAVENAPRSEQTRRIESEPKQYQLPSGPRSSQPVHKVDLSQVPRNQPFEAYIGNIPFDADEREIEQLIYDLTGERADEVKVLKNPVTNMNKGFGFVKLPNRDALIRLLLTSKPMFRGRELRIDLNTDRGDRQQQSRDGQTQSRQGGYQRNRQQGRYDGGGEEYGYRDQRSYRQQQYDGGRHQQQNYQGSNWNEARNERDPYYNYPNEAPNYASSKHDRQYQGEVSQYGTMPRTARQYSQESSGDYARDHYRDDSMQYQRDEPVRRYVGDDNGAMGNQQYRRHSNADRIPPDSSHQHDYYQSQQAHHPSTQSQYGHGGEPYNYQSVQQRHQYDGDAPQRGGYGRHGGRGDPGYQSSMRHPDGYRSNNYTTGPDRVGGPIHHRMRSDDGDHSEMGDANYQSGDYQETRDRPRINRAGSPSVEKEVPKERPRLNLQPRTKPVGEVEKRQRSPGRNTSIFGLAKPVDTTQKEKEVETRLKEEQERLRSLMEEKEAERKVKPPLRVETRRRTGDRERTMSQSSGMGGGNGPMRSPKSPLNVASDRMELKPERIHSSRSTTSSDAADRLNQLPSMTADMNLSEREGEDIGGDERDMKPAQLRRGDSQDSASNGVSTTVPDSNWERPTRRQPSKDGVSHGPTYTSRFFTPSNRGRPNGHGPERYGRGGGGGGMARNDTRTSNRNGNAGGDYPSNTMSGQQQQRGNRRQPPPQNRPPRFTQQHDTDNRHTAGGGGSSAMQRQPVADNPRVGKPMIHKEDKVPNFEDVNPYGLLDGDVNDDE